MADGFVGDTSQSGVGKSSVVTIIKVGEFGDVIQSNICKVLIYNTTIKVGEVWDESQSSVCKVYVITTIKVCEVWKVS